MARRDLIDVAMGRENADLVIRGGKLVNVMTAEIYEADVAVKGDRIAYIGNASHTIGDQSQVIDAKGKYITPGLIETHYHSYESHMNLTQLAIAMLPNGTTSLPMAFYGEGIVGGVKAIKFFYNELRVTPVRCLFQVPVLAYLQNVELGFPKTAQSPTIEDSKEMLDWPGCVGIEEPPAIPIYEKDPEMLDLFETTLAKGKVITGHGAELYGKELTAYLSMGAASDHETVSVEEAIEKVRLGMYISIRQGTQLTDLLTLIKAITEKKLDTRYFNFCNDIASPSKLAHEGNLDENIRLAISAGVNPITAVQMATINAADLLKVSQDLGSIAPGKYADILLVDELVGFKVVMTIVGGKIVAKDGKMVMDLKQPKYPDYMYNTMKVKGKVAAEDFQLKVPPGKKEVLVRVIDSPEGCIITEEKKIRLNIVNGEIQPDIKNDVLKIVMVDRFEKSGRIGIGFVQGFKLKVGAMGSTYNPVMENILVVGTNDQDISVAVNELVEMGGGFIAVRNKKVEARLELPLLGLLSDESFETVVEKEKKINSVLHSFGCEYRDPFSTLAFLGVCGEVGVLKISDRGLYNCHKRKLVETVIK